MAVELRDAQGDCFEKLSTLFIADGAPATDDCVDVPPDRTLQRSNWAAVDVPDFSQFSLIIAVVPHEPGIFERFRGDISQAEGAGATIIWLMTPESSTAGFQQMTGCETFRQRNLHAISATAGTPFAEYLRDVSYCVLFRIPRGATALVPIGLDGRLTAAYLDESQHSHIRIVLPATARPENDLESLRQIASSMHRSRAPIVVAKRRATVAVALVLSFVAATVGARYSQRMFNNSAFVGSVAYIVNNDEEQDPFNRSLPGEPDNASQLLFGEAEQDLPEAARIASFLGAHELVAQQVWRAIQIQDCTILRQVADTLFAASVQHARKRAYEDSKMLLRQMTAGLARSTTCPWYSGYGGRLFHVRRMTALMNRGYVWHDHDEVRVMLDTLAPMDAWEVGWVDDEPGVIIDPARVDASLSAEARYTTLANIYQHLRRTGVSGSAEVLELSKRWQAFSEDIRRHGNGLFREEVEYNIALTELLRLQLSQDARDLARARADAANRFRRFVVAYPGSYLADDALMLASRLNLANGDQDRGLWMLTILLREYSDTDSVPGIRARVAERLQFYGGCWAHVCRRIAGDLVELALRVASSEPISLGNYSRELRSTVTRLARGRALSEPAMVRLATARLLE